MDESSNDCFGCHEVVVRDGMNDEASSGEMKITENDLDSSSSSSSSSLSLSPSAGKEDHVHDDDAAAEGSCPAVETTPSNVEFSMERLLQRQRSEIMFELRRLQYGDRPVTGQEQRRRTVENLVLRAVGPAVSSGQRHPLVSGPNPAAAAARLTDETTDQSGSHRPEEILVEVSALVERRPVSSILQSLTIRRSLENSIRDVLRRPTMARSGLVGPSPQLLQQQTASTSGRTTPPQPSSSSSAAAAASAVAAASVELPARAAAREEDSSPSASNASSSPSPLSQQSTGDIPNARTDAGPAAGVHHPSISVTSAAGNGHQMELNEITRSWDERRSTRQSDMNQFYHEQFIAEVSDLIHRQLVTSTLNGGFRDVLERRMRRHVERSGIDGTRVQEQVRQLPRSTIHMRNDFFDLGIMSGAAEVDADGLADVEDGQLDNMSVISATAAVTVPHAYTQSNVAVNRELQSVKCEIQELKSLMRLSFDLQLDIQRSIRQEVAAALNNIAGGASNLQFPAAAAAAAAAVGGQGAPSNGQCLVCVDEQVDTVLYRCGHLCLCHACAMRLRQAGAHCPVCRAPIVDITKIYRP